MDDRAVSEVLGFIMVVSLVVMLIALLQVVAVPTWNASSEADHGQQFQADMVGFHGDVVTTATDGGDRSPSLTLGLRYGGAGFFLRPPPSQGTLTTTSAELRFEDITVQTDRDDHPEEAFFDQWESSSKLLEYEPSYTEREEVTTHYEHTTVLQEQAGQTITQAGSVVDGRTIRLVSLSGDVDLTRANRESISVREESVSTRTIRLEPEGEITLSTTRGTEFWEEQLDDSPATVSAVDEESETVTISLADGEEPYRLKLASVRIGDREPESPAVAYVVARDPVVGVDETARVEARDRFGNPVSNADLSPYLTDECGDETRTRTDENGQLRLSCSQPGEFIFFEDEPYAETVTVVGTGEQAEPATITAPPSSADTETFRTSPTDGEGELPQTQLTVPYTVEVGETAGSELDRVEIRLVDRRDGEELLSSTTHSYRGASPENGVHEGQWTTPWFTDGFQQLGDNHELELVAVTADGIRTECTIDGVSGC